MDLRDRHQASRVVGALDITTFEACSSFTRVTACRSAHPPYVGFITRLHPCRLPGSGARKLSSSTNNLLEWVLPPLVISAVEAHTGTAFIQNWSLLTSGDKRQEESYLSSITARDGSSRAVRHDPSGSFIDEPSEIGYRVHECAGTVSF